ncbi:DMT family transporter [Paenibacillus caui]|uniref:DMT family transporter n=1 Tax=Paenibacillus caui TaxID=2873927 RepID=UPI001CA9E288|nr:DMT family transporter [Paenibacillus caui]
MNRSRLADLSLLAVALMWGCTFLIVQHAVHALPPLMFNAVRFIGASVLLAMIITLFYRKQWLNISWRMAGHGLLLGLLLFAGYGLQTMGLLYTTTSNAGFITGLSVILVPFLSMFLFRSKLSKSIWISAALAAAGLYLLTFSSGGMSLGKGDALILLCAIAFALHIGFTGVFAPRYPALPLAALQLGATGLFSLAASLAFEATGSAGELTHTILLPKVFYALLISIGPTSAFAFWIQTVAQQHTTPARVAVIFAMEPVFAAATGVIFAGEQLGWIALLGCASILAGILLSELNPGETSRQSPRSTKLQETSS